MDVAVWLTRLGLPQYIEPFQANEIQSSVLKKLTADDLKEIGVGPVGHRRQILAAIEDLTEVDVGSPDDPQEAFGPERRHLTVLFCDVVGSTALAGSMDPEDLREVIRRYHALVADVVRSNGGFVAQYLGDGAMIYFGYPTAREDDAERAVRTALALAEQAKTLQVNGQSLQVRAGLATGLVVVGDRAEGSQASHEPRIMGETPNLAARLQGLAEPGGVIIDGPTSRLIGRTFQLGEREPADLKGFDQPVQSWAVLGEAGVDDRFKALRSVTMPFIGREEELDLLSRRWRQVAEEGGKAVLISGEPGLGKSRLLTAARDMIATDDPQIITYFCSANFANTALHPILRQIQRSCDITPNDTQDTRRGKLEGLLEALSTPEALALLADLLSINGLADPDPIAHLSPTERRKATFELLIRHLASTASARRLVVVFEDIHWADPSTLELLDLLIMQIESHPILLIATYRPEFQPAWAGLGQVSVITLSRLQPSQRRRLIEAVAGPGLLPPELIDEIADRTDGVPLFAEELTKATAEAKRDSAGSETLLHKAARGSIIPVTLHASLMARLDRLGPTARNVAQTGAVIGREFSHELLSSVWAGAPAEMEKALDQLRTAGLVSARGAGDQATYVFKHALVQDAAYSTLLRDKKHGLHRAVAERLSQRAGASTFAELIARHYREAQKFRRAAEWRLKAGEASNERGAYKEAIENLQGGLADVTLLPETNERKELELNLIVALSAPIIALYITGPAQLTQLIERAEVLSAQLERPLPPSLLFAQWLRHWNRREHDLGAKVALRLEQSMKDHPIGLRGKCARLLSELMSGHDVEILKTEFEYAYETMFSFGSEVDHLRFAYFFDFKVITVLGHSWALWHAGFPDKAVHILHVGQARALEIRHYPSLCNVLMYEIVVHALRGDVQLMQSRATELGDIARHHDLPMWARVASWYYECSRALQGGTEGVRAASEILTSEPFLNSPGSLGMLARVYDIAGRGDEALATIDQAIALALSSGEKIDLSELRRRRGELLNGYRGAAAEPEAEREFCKALTFARKQKSLSHELQVTHSLANLMRRRGDEAGALRLLEPVFNRFTEGFDTAALIAAKRTIDELRVRVRPATRLAAS